MEGSSVLLIFVGLVLIGYGILLFKKPDIEWQLSLARRWFLKGGEPTESYFAMQRIQAVIDVVVGALLILAGISTFFTAVKGYVVEIDGNALKIPCAYSDIVELGYQIDPNEDVKTLTATDKVKKNGVTYTVKNAEGKTMELRFENRGTTDKKATECQLIAIKVDETGPAFKLPNGVHVGMSETEAKKIMGNGTPKGVGGSASEHTMNVNFDSYRINLIYSEDLFNRTIIAIRVTDSIY